MKDNRPRGVRIAHIGIAVRALGDSLPFYRDVWDCPRCRSRRDGATIVGSQRRRSRRAARSCLPGLAGGTFVERRGPGIHHICFVVDDSMRPRRCRALAPLIDDVRALARRENESRFFNPSSTSVSARELTED